MNIPILSDIVIILGISVFIVLIFQRLKLPSILGFLGTGVPIGPHGLGFVQASHEIELLSEIGIIFLLFVIGIEFSLSSLASIKKTVIGGGLMQVFGTIGITAVLARFSGLSWNEAVFLGFVFSLSSTAIVLKLLQESGEVTAPHGRISVAILIFQDIIVVPMMLAVPILAGETVLFGDATDPVILQHVRVHKARVVVVAISDAATTKKIVRIVRDFSEVAYIIVRTRYSREITENLRIGADEVIPEEFETSIEIFTSVLKKYLVPMDEIQRFINTVRSHNYDLLLSENPGRKFSGTELHIPSMEIATLKVQQGDNKVVGKTIAESKLRSHFGITVLSIKRGEKYLKNLGPEDQILQDDVLYIFGSPDHISDFNTYLKM